MPDHWSRQNLLRVLASDGENLNTARCRWMISWQRSKTADDAGHDVARCIRAIFRCGLPWAKSCGPVDATMRYQYEHHPGGLPLPLLPPRLGTELTLPCRTYHWWLTRTSGGASAMPRRRTLRNFAATGATLARSTCRYIADGCSRGLSPLRRGLPCPIVWRAAARPKGGRAKLGAP